MSIILAVNGIVETYPVKPAVPQNGRADSLGERGPSWPTVIFAGLISFGSANR